MALSCRAVGVGMGAPRGTCAHPCRPGGTTAPSYGGTVGDGGATGRSYGGTGGVGRATARS
ncbi:hypothetical protein GCM10010276_00750 [Streptomyces longisporus]|uniref:Uncharacterized protein n=1 Tax=Streptomyces longisporus TaxID=1948 RepID=A0ABN3KV54_STRLO